MKRDVVRFPGIRPTWYPHYSATGFFLDAQLPNPPYTGRPGDVLIGRWTRWESEAIFPSHETPQSPAIDWWQRAWLRLSPPRDRFPARGSEAYQTLRQLRKEALGNRTDYREDQQLLYRFLNLLSWPQESGPILHFAARFGPLYRAQIVRDPARTYRPASFDEGERALEWFLSLRRCAAIFTLMNLASCEKPELPLDDHFQSDCDVLAACSEDLAIFGQDEPFSLTIWHMSTGNRPESWIESIRRGQAESGHFLMRARRAFTEIMQKESRHFVHRFDLPSEGGISLEAWTLMGAIYAALYDDFASTRKGRVCVVCKKLFVGRSDARTCSDNCRKQRSRRSRLEGL